MIVACGSCGYRLAPGTKFCPECGAEAGAPVRAAGGEARKLVTVLFADATGSTAPGRAARSGDAARPDGPLLRGMKRVIEAHGGTVEKFIGDAVMAVFGDPDHARGRRAAGRPGGRRDPDGAGRPQRRAARRRGGSRSGSGPASTPARSWPATPATGQTLVTGDAVNTAARLEQAAAPGEILLGRLDLAAGPGRRGRSSRVDAIPVKGKAQPVEAYRLLVGPPGCRRPCPPARHAVGRAGARARATRPGVPRRSSRIARATCSRCSAAPGVGKSRLAAEFADAVAGEATVLRGRCLPYGDGITYWPIGEIVRVGGRDRGGGPGGGRPGEGPRPARGRTGGGPHRPGGRGGDRALGRARPPQEELFWAIRRLLEHLAAERPLVVVIEDIHWAEPTLLDLIDHVADWSRDAPILLLCPARPELLDARTGWGGGKLNATTILLEPLAAEATARLHRRAAGRQRCCRARSRSGSPRPRRAIPLFVEEMLAMLRRRRPAGRGGPTEPGARRRRSTPSVSRLRSARSSRRGWSACARRSGPSPSGRSRGRPGVRAGGRRGRWRPTRSGPMSAAASSRSSARSSSGPSGPTWSRARPSSSATS